MSSGFVPKPKYISNWNWRQLIYLAFWQFYLKIKQRIGVNFN